MATQVQQFHRLEHAKKNAENMGLIVELAFERIEVRRSKKKHPEYVEDNVIASFPTVEELTAFLQGWERHGCLSEIEKMVTPARELPSFTVADVSTCHMTAGDNQLLQEEDDKQPLIIINYPNYGYFIYTGFEPNEAEIQEFGYSALLYDVLKRAYDEGHKYVNFDCDGEVVDTLRKEDW